MLLSFADIFAGTIYRLFFVVHVFYLIREQNLSRSRDIANNRLIDWKRKFVDRVRDIQKQVHEFKGKDRMTDADMYLSQLKDIAKKLDEYQSEVRTAYTVLVL